MAKFKVKFKIQALELEVEGEREAVPEITGAIRQQLGALLSAPQEIADPVGSSLPEKNITPQVVEAKPARKRSSRTNRPAVEGATNGAIEFRHDPGNWGNPKQSWSTSQKAMWLLFVVKNQASVNEMSGSQISSTFNKHFRQAGSILTGTVNRDMGVAKGKAPALVGEDTTKDPGQWFLTDEGTNSARKLVAEAKGASTQEAV